MRNPNDSSCDDDDDEVLDEDEDESSSDEDDEDSVLSGPKWRDYWPKDATKPAHHRQKTSLRRKGTSLRTKWQEHQLAFSKRELLLNRIGVGKSHAFIRQIRERELLVQLQTLDALLRHSSQDESQTREQRTYKELQQALENLRISVRSRPQSWKGQLEKWRDSVVFEMNSLVPSVIALLVHTTALNSIYDGLNMSVEVSKQFIVSFQWIDRKWVDLSFVGFTLAWGIFLLRCTGDLYWWLSDPDFDLVKFDFHNRRRLRFWDARILATVRVRSTIRAILFLVGYHYCYSSMSAFLFWMERYFDQSKDVLANLPSAVFAANKGYCWAGLDESVCTASCQAEMAHQELEFLVLKQADLEYTASVLSSGSYEMFWFQWTQNDGLLVGGEAQLFQKYHHAAYIFSSVMIAIFILAAYGFKFWGKY